MLLPQRGNNRCPPVSLLRRGMARLRSEIPGATCLHGRLAPQSHVSCAAKKSPMQAIPSATCSVAGATAHPCPPKCLFNYSQLGLSSLMVAAPDYRTSCHHLNQDSPRANPLQYFFCLCRYPCLKDAVVICSVLVITIYINAKPCDLLEAGIECSYLIPSVSSSQLPESRRSRLPPLGALRRSCPKPIRPPSTVFLLPRFDPQRPDAGDSLD